MTKQRYDSVWEALEDAPAKVENMKVRSELMMALKKHIDDTELSPAQTVKGIRRDPVTCFRSDARQNQPIRHRCTGLYGSDSRSAPGNARTESLNLSERASVAPLLKRKR
jgi:hypothetical protein